MAKKFEIDQLAATHALRAATLLLDWIAQGDEGSPDEATLDDAVTFARLALKRHAETQPS